MSQVKTYTKKGIEAAMQATGIWYHKSSSGFAILMVMFIIATGLSLVTTVLVQVTSGNILSSYVYKREHAKQIALLGIKIVQSNLSYDKTDEKACARTYEWLFNRINSWQTYELQKETDEADGQLQLYISCEEGKLNPNMWFDAQKKSFTLDGSAQQMLKKLGGILSPKERDAESLTKGLQDALRKQKTLLDDVSLMVPEKFGEKTDLTIALFTSPPEQTSANLAGENSPGDNAKQESSPALFDAFTTATNPAQTIEPLFFSRSIQKYLGLTGWPTEKQQRGKVAKQVAQALSTETVDWKQWWDTLLAPIFGKKFAQIDNGLLPSKFGNSCRAKYVSVVCYGKFGKVTQKLYAVLR